MVGGVALVAAATVVLGVVSATNRTPPPLVLSDQSQLPLATAPTTAPSPTSDIGCREGGLAAEEVAWTVAAGSEAGFRTHEQFLGYLDTDFAHEAVARSDRVMGYVLATADRTELRSGCITVDLRALKSIDKLPAPLPPSSNRDELFEFILGLDAHPIATLELYPTPLPTVQLGQKVHFTVFGDLSIHGVTQPVRFAVDCRWRGSNAQCAGSSVVDVRYFGVVVPGANGPIKVDPNVTIEFAVALVQSPT